MELEQSQWYRNSQANQATEERFKQLIATDFADCIPIQKYRTEQSKRSGRYYLFRREKDQPWTFNGVYYFKFQVEHLEKLLAEMGEELMGIREEEIPLAEFSLVPDVARINQQLKILNNIK